MMKVHIFDDLFGIPRIYFVVYDQDGTVTHIAKPIDLVFEPYTQATRIPDRPTIDFGSARQTEAFLQSFADALRQRQKPSPTDNRLLGQLEATERHLNDLQMLLRLKANPHREAPNGKPLE
jgi:hypothetical protein